VRHLIAGPSLAAALLSAGSFAAAQTPSDTAAAEVLFKDAQALYDAGDFSTACPKFQASYALDRGLGTLLNLARCYEQQGRTASAWAAYVDLAPLALRAGQADRNRIAEERIEALGPGLMRIALRVPSDARFEVLLDEQRLAPELFGSALPVDPGAHTVAARRDAGSDSYWSLPITVSQPGETVEVTVPTPPEKPTTPPEALLSPPPTAAPIAPPAPTPVPAPTRDASSAWIPAGAVVGGAGLVLLGVGAAFGVKASTDWSDAGCRDGLCPNARAQERAERAGASADLATGFAIAGGVAATTGAVLLLLGLSKNGGDETVGGAPVDAIVRF
jgi:serine/threonine-protein kinase